MAEMLPPRRELIRAVLISIPLGMTVFLLLDAQDSKTWLAVFALVFVTLLLVAVLLVGARAFALWRDPGHRACLRIGEVVVGLPDGAAFGAARSALRALRDVELETAEPEAGLLEASTGPSGRSFGERIRVRVSPAPSGAAIRAESWSRVRLTLWDGGKNRQNVKAVLSRLDAGGENEGAPAPKAG